MGIAESILSNAEGLPPSYNCGCHAERYGKRRVSSVKHLVFVCIL
jgi:hypothetical protein